MRVSYLALAATAMAASAVPAHALINSGVRVLVPDGQILLVSNQPGRPWYTDNRLKGYNLFTYDPGQSLYVVYATDAYHYRNHHFVPIPPKAENSGKQWSWNVMPEAKRPRRSFQTTSWEVLAQNNMPANWQQRYYGGSSSGGYAGGWHGGGHGGGMYGGGNNNNSNNQYGGHYRSYSRYVNQQHAGEQGTAGGHYDSRGGFFTNHGTYISPNGVVYTQGHPGYPGSGGGGGHGSGNHGGNGSHGGGGMMHGHGGGGHHGGGRY